MRTTSEPPWYFADVARGVCVCVRACLCVHARTLRAQVDANVVIVAVSQDVMVGDTVVILGCDEAARDVCAMPTLSTRIPSHLPRFYL